MSISRSSTICNMGKMQNFWDSTNGKWNEWGALWGLGDCQNLILKISHCCFAENGTSSYFSARRMCNMIIFSIQLFYEVSLALLQSHTVLHSASCFDVFYNRLALFVSIDSSDKFWNYFLTCLPFSSLQVINEPWITAEPTNRSVHLENPAPVARGRLMSS